MYQENLGTSGKVCFLLPFGVRLRQIKIIQRCKTISTNLILKIDPFSSDVRLNLGSDSKRCQTQNGVRLNLGSDLIWGQT